MSLTHKQVPNIDMGTNRALRRNSFVAQEETPDQQKRQCFPVGGRAPTCNPSTGSMLTKTDFGHDQQCTYYHLFYEKPNMSIFSHPTTLT